MFAFDSKKYTKKLLPLMSWSHWFTFFNIAAAILLSSLYFVSETIPDSALGYIYLLTTWFSHMAFLTFIGFVLIVFPITLLHPNSRFIRTFASITFTLGLLFLILDAFIYSRLGYHLNASSSTQIIDLLANVIKTDATTFFTISLCLFIAILCFEFIVSNYAWKHIKSLQKRVFARPVVMVLVGMFFFSHLTHMWADTSLDYDVLRQDTVLPLSYPLTAKTLLTKYQLFNKDDYLERKTSPLTFTDNVPNYPVLSDKHCTISTKIKPAMFMVLTSDMITTTQQQHFKSRATSPVINLNHHIDSAIKNDSWFNLFYSLPTIYQKSVLAQAKPPLLFQAIKQQDLMTSFTVIGKKSAADEASIESLWFKPFFKKQIELADISSLIFADKLNNIQPGLHVIYFPKDNTYQFDLFMHALLLAQKQKSTKDIIWISSLGNEKQKTILSIKPSTLIWPMAKAKQIDEITSHMDLQSTLLKNWLDCDSPKLSYALANGRDLLSLDLDRVIANTMKKGIVVFNKDKSVMIDQNGHFQSYSRQLETPIDEKSNFPLLIDAVHFIKQFSDQAPK